MNELKEIFLELDKDHTGYISARELRHAVVGLGHPEAASEIKNIVKQVDYLKNGRINYSEFLIATLNKKEEIDD